MAWKLYTRYGPWKTNLHQGCLLNSRCETYCSHTSAVADRHAAVAAVCLTSASTGQRPSLLPRTWYASLHQDACCHQRQCATFLVGTSMPLFAYSSCENDGIYVYGRRIRPCWAARSLAVCGLDLSTSSNYAGSLQPRSTWTSLAPPLTLAIRLCSMLLDEQCVCANI